MPDYRRPKHEVAASDPNRDTTCPFCEAPTKTEIVDQTFQHGAVEISVTLPVRQCADCDEEFVDYVGERIRTEAVYYAFGLLSPWDIRAIRKRRRLSRPAFAEITGHGEATIKRWETGAIAQNPANDRYLRLMDTAFGWATLKRIAESGREPVARTQRRGAENARFPYARPKPVPGQSVAVAEESSFSRRKVPFQLQAA